MSFCKNLHLAKNKTAKLEELEKLHLKISEWKKTRINAKELSEKYDTAIGHCYLNMME